MSLNKLLSDRTNKISISKLFVLILLSISFVHFAAAAPLSGCPSGLVSYWQLDENSGTTISDSYSGHNGTFVNSPEWTIGKVNSGINFSNQDYIEVPHSSDLDITGDVTIAMWIKPNSLTCSGADPAYALISKRTYNHATPYEVMICCGGNACFHYWGTKIAYPGFASNVTLSVGTWQHLVVVRSFSGTVATVTFYINGVESGRTSQDTGAAQASGDKVWISRDGYHSTYTNEGTYSGLMDEIAIFNRALSASEVQQLYYNTMNGRNYCAQASLPINFTSPTPANGSTITTNYTQINATIDTATALDTFKFNWNGVNYSIYDPSLVLAMNFNNNSAIGENATKAVDISKYGNNGTIYGATWTTDGRFGSAMNFDGVDDYIVVPDSASLNPSQITIEFWLKPLRSATERVINKGSPYSNGWAITYYSTQIGFTAYIAGARQSLNTIALPSNTWHHVVATYDGIAMRLYVNGTLVGNYSISGTIPSNTAGLEIGRGQGTYYFNGTIDEVRIYNRSLSADEIRMHYQSEFQKYNSTQYRFYSNITNLSNGTYTYYAWANDTSGLSGQTETRTLNVGGAPPVLNFTSPTPANGSTITTNYTQINATIDTATALDTFKFNWNGVNYSIYDPSLVLAMNFNNNSAIGETGTKVVDISKYGNNGTCTNMGSSCAFTSSGRFGSALSFDGVDDYVESSLPSLGGSSISISLWLNRVGIGTGTWHDILTSRWYWSGTNQRQYQLAITVTGEPNKIFWGVSTDGLDRNPWVYSNTSIEFGKWYHIVVTYDKDSGYERIYINGNLDAEKSFSAGGLFDTTLPQQIGIKRDSIGGTPNEPFNGTIDEVRIYNRALSPQEIKMIYQSEFQKYNSTQYRFYINITNLSNGTYTYYAWANDTSGLSGQTETRTLTIGEVVNPIGSCVSIIQPGKYILTQNVSSNGTCFTIAANNVTLDCNGYTITYAQTTSNTYGIYVNGYNSATIKNCNILQTNSSVSYAHAIYLSNAGNSTIKNNTISVNGRSSYGVYLSSSSNNNFTNNTISSTRSFGAYLYSSSNYNTFTNNNISAYSHGAYLDSSSNNTFINNNISSEYGRGAILTNSSENTFINNTISSTNYDAVFLSSSSNYNNFISNTIYSTNIYLTTSNGIRLESAFNNSFINNIVKGGAIDFVSTDSSGNTIINITFNSTAYPTTASFIYDGNISVDSANVVPSPGFLNVSKYLNITNQSAAWIYINFSYSNDTIGSNETKLRLYRWNGSNWNYVPGSAVDTVNKIVYANITQFSVFSPLADITPPSISITYPTSGSHMLSPDLIFTINYTVSDASLNYTNISIYQAGSLINSTTSTSSGNVSVQLGVPAAGYYNITATAYDLIGNSNSSSVTNIEIYSDTTPPVVTLMYPANGARINSSSVTFTFTATDDASQTMSCSIYLDDVLNQINGSTLNNTVTSFTINGIPDGTHAWKVNCSDSASNPGVSETRSFSVDTVPPTLQFISPTPANGATITKNHAFINVSSSENLSSCTLNWNSMFYPMTIVNNGALTYAYYNVAGLTFATYYYNVSCNDTYGNVNSTETRSVSYVEYIEVSITPTSINFGTMDPGTNSTSIVSINVTNTENSNVPIYLSFNGTNFVSNGNSFGIGNLALRVNATMPDYTYFTSSHSISQTELACTSARYSLSQDCSNISINQTVNLWFNIRVPNGQPAGSYAANVTIKATGIS